MKWHQWKLESRHEQENFANLLSDRIWDAFSYPEDKQLMFQKIAIALYGPPKEDSEGLGLSEEQKVVVDDIQTKCLQHSCGKSVICLAFIFIHVYNDENDQVSVPLVRVKNHYRTSHYYVPENVYIDHLGRVYNSWNNYKEKNTWTKAWLCVPVEGYYKPDIEVDFLNQESRGKIIEVLDKVSTLTSIASTVGLLTGTALTFFPPTAFLGALLVPLSTACGAPGAVYGAGRSAEELLNRKKHEQSVSISDPEARQCWLTTAASLVSVGSFGASRLLARTATTGNTVSSTARAVCTAINVTSVTVTGIGLANAARDISRKKEVTPLDMFQLTTSIFFFTHSIVSFKTASTIIRDAEAKRPLGYSEAVTRKIRNVLRLSETSSGKVKVPVTNAKVEFISNINRIPDVLKNLKVVSNEAKLVSNEHNASSSLMEQDGEFILSKRSDSDRSQVQSSNMTTYPKTATGEPTNKPYLNMNQGMEFLMEMVEAGNTIIKTACQNYAQEGPKSSEESEDLNFVSKDVQGGIGNEETGGTLYTFTDSPLEDNRTPVREVRPGSIVDYDDDDLYDHDNYYYYDNDHYNDSEAEELVEADEHRNSALGALEASEECTSAASSNENKSLFPEDSPYNNLKPEVYFKIAEEMANCKISYVEWSQDGSYLTGTFCTEEFEDMTIVYCNLSSKTSVLVILMGDEGKNVTRRLTVKDYEQNS